MKDFIIVAILLVIVGLAVCYIIKSKKSGAKCIGCPSGGNCSAFQKEGNACSCGCSEHGENEKK